MFDRTRNSNIAARTVLAAGVLLLPALASAQSAAAPEKASQAAESKSTDRWLHIRVISSEAKGETVRVNIPLDLAEKVLPAINKDHLRDGKVKIDEAHMQDIDLRAMIDAVRSSKDGEFVTVQSNDADVRVAKKDGHLLVHVIDKENAKKAQVEIKIPMKVIDALFSAGKDELDLVAALHALSAQGDTELVSVKSTENTVRIWLDSKSVTD